MDIERIISAKEKYIYSFERIDDCMVFNSFHILKKPKSKRKWINEHTWERSGGGDIREPSIPESVRNEALEKFRSLLKVQSWDEHIFERVFYKQN